MNKLNLKTMSLMLVLLLFTTFSIGAYAATQRVESSRNHYMVDKVPEWVVVTPFNHTNSNDKHNIRYFLSDKQAKVSSSDSDFESYTHIVYSPLRYSGLQEAAEVGIDFRPSYEELTIHNVSLLRDGKVINKLENEQ